MDVIVDPIDDIDNKQVPQISTDDINPDNDVNRDQNNVQNDCKPEESIKEEESADHLLRFSPIGFTTPADETDDKTSENDDKENDDQVFNTTSKYADNGSTRHQYSKEELIAISKLSTARIRPKCLDSAFNKAPELTPTQHPNPNNRYNDSSRANNLWDPEKWMSNRSSASGGPTNGRNNRRDGSESFPKKTANELTERVKEEGNGLLGNIVLSPQRNTFAHGCQPAALPAKVATNESRSRDTHIERNRSLEDVNDRYPQKDSYRRNMDRTERFVGSGRIQPKDRDFPSSGDYYGDKDRRSGGAFDREGGDRRYDSRGNDRNYDRNNGYRRDSRDDGRRGDRADNDYNNDPRNKSDRFRNQRNNEPQSRGYYRNEHRNRYEEETPEWFTDDEPMTFMDLGGFEGDERGSDNHRKSSEGKAQSPSKESSINDNKPKKVEPSARPSMQSSTPPKSSSVGGMDAPKSEPQTASDEFDVNAMFKMDDWFKNGQNSEPKGISNSVDNAEAVESKGISRFDRWVTKEAPNNDMSANSGPTQHQMESKMMPPMARPTGTDHSPNSYHSPNRNIIDMLMGSSQSPTHHMAANPHNQKFDPMSRPATNAMKPSHPVSHTPQMARPVTNQTPNAFSSPPVANDRNRNIIEMLMSAPSAQRMPPNAGHFGSGGGHPVLDPSKAVNLAELEGNFKQMPVRAPVNEGPTNDRQAFDKLLHELNKRSSTQRMDHSMKGGDASILQTHNQNIVIPQSCQPVGNAPSIMDLLTMQERHEAIEMMDRRAQTADDVQRIRAQNEAIMGHRNGRAGVPPTVMYSMNTQPNAAMPGGGGGRDLMQTQPNNWSPPNANMNAIPSNREVYDNTQQLIREAIAKRQQQEQTLRAQQQQQQQQQQIHNNHYRQQQQHQQQLEAQQMQNKYLLQQRQQQLDAILKAQQMNDSHIRTNTPPIGARGGGVAQSATAGHFTPTSVMRKMHSNDRDRDLVNKTSASFDEMSVAVDGNSSHQRFQNDYLTNKQSIPSMRAIIKSNNSPNSPIGHHNHHTEQLPKLYNK